MMKLKEDPGNKRGSFLWESLLLSTVLIGDCHLATKSVRYSANRNCGQERNFVTMKVIKTLLE
jgi:hypothetical protein